MKQFDVPSFYRSPLLSRIKSKRKVVDKLKKDFSPTLLDFGPLKIYLARHFGFCYGVENAIEIAYRCIDENPGKRIYLLSEMIHNPQVNNDLQSKGVQFLQNFHGETLIPFSELRPDDIVIIPAFGTTLAIEEKLREAGISPHQYNTTCPFVEKVWNRGEQLGKKGYSLIIHGKPAHEETRATFSRVASHSPAIIINNMAESLELSKFITGEKSQQEFEQIFAGRYSTGFDIKRDLKFVGVINQTTQLATDTQAIADYLKDVVESLIVVEEQDENRKNFADTRDTLCYATNDNQSAVREMLDQPADLAIVVGGYNSSNTSHLVELCENKMQTYYINAAASLESREKVVHFNWRTKTLLQSYDYIPEKDPVSILLTSGASCPDALVEEVIHRLVEFFPGSKDLEEVEIHWLDE